MAFIVAASSLFVEDQQGTEHKKHKKMDFLVPLVLLVVPSPSFAG